MFMVTLFFQAPYISPAPMLPLQKRADRASLG
jgi:hypothetical protein